MVLSDSSIGNILHITCTILLVYYLVWVLGTPFVDIDHPFQNFFPPKEYGVAIPAVVLGTAFTFLTTVAFVCMYGVPPPQDVGIIPAPTTTTKNDVNSLDASSKRKRFQKKNTKRTSQAEYYDDEDDLEEEMKFERESPLYNQLRK